MDSIRKLVKDKSVLFVGNSVEIMNHKLKKFIDGFDIVVKFGAAIQATKEHQEHIGTRADIWITGQFRSPAYNELKEEFTNGRYKNTKILVNRCRGNFKLKSWILEERLPEGMPYEQMYSDQEIIDLMKNKFNKDMLDSKEYRPSAGFISLLWFIDKIKTYKNIHLIGFDFFSKQANIQVRDKRGVASNCKPHSWHLPCYVLNRPAHDSDMEKNYVEKLVRNNLVHWYKLSDLKPGVIPYTGWMHGQKLVKSAPKYSKVSKILPTTLYHQHYKFNTNKIT